MMFRLASLLLLATACASVPVLPASKPLFPGVTAVSPPVRPWLHQLGLAPRVWDVKRGERYSSQDWLTNVLSIPRSLTLKRISSHLVANLLVTAFVLLLRVKGMPIAMPALPHQLTGSFLGLLLVFRTNAAYARFWEARHLWGRVKAVVRKLCLTTLTSVQPTEPQRAAYLLSLLSAFPLALGRLCTGSSEPFPPGVSALLPAGTPSGGSAAAMALCLQLQLCVAEFSAQLRQREGSSDVHAASVEEAAEHLVGELVSCIGGCELIRRTPVPFMYSRHTSRALTLFLGTLPLVLVDLLGAAALPTMAGICWCIFGIEEIGHLIEQPFYARRFGSDQTGPSSRSSDDGEADASWCSGVPLKSRLHNPAHPRCSPVTYASLGVAACRSTRLPRA